MLDELDERGMEAVRLDKLEAAEVEKPLSSGSGSAYPLLGGEGTSIGTDWAVGKVV